MICRRREKLKTEMRNEKAERGNDWSEALQAGQDMPGMVMDHQPGQPLIPVGGIKIVGLFDHTSGKAGANTVHINTSINVRQRSGSGLFSRSAGRCPGKQLAKEDSGSEWLRR